jgi:Mg2+ and Co2+ transporter CorA
MVKDSLTDQAAALSLKASQQSLEASRQSIAESKKVNRFTLVAWVFIPLSLISSVFGMNVAELSQGPPISLFFEIAGPVVIIALVLEWWFVQPSEKRKTLLSHFRPTPTYKVV